LVCVRYKDISYDKKHKKKVKTVEIIVHKGSWEADRKKSNAFKGYI